MIAHDIYEPWEISDPTSDTSITEEDITFLFSEYEYLFDPRRWKLPAARGLLPVGEAEASWN